MGLGALSHVGIGKESAWGTPVSATDYLKFSTESISHAIEELVSVSLNGRRDESESYEGLSTISGDTVHEVHPNGLGYLLHSFFNGITSVQQGATSAYKHDFVPSDAEFSANCAVQPYTLEVHRDMGDAFQFVGMVVNTLAFNFGVGAKILGLTASWLGKDLTKITKTTPSLEVTEPFRWNQAKIEIGGSQNNDIETVGISLENGLAAIPTLNNTKLVSRILGDAFRTGTLTCSFIVPDDDPEFWDKFRAWTTQQFVITFEGVTIETPYKYTLKLTFPKVLYTAYPIAIGGSGRLTAGVTGKIKYDASAGHFCKIELTNTKTSY